MSGRRAGHRAGCLAAILLDELRHSLPTLRSLPRHGEDDQQACLHAASANIAGVMASERLQRRIEAFLDEADAAAQRYEWSRVAEAARAALAIDEANADALTYFKMAEANLGAVPSTGDAPPRAEPSKSAEQPSSFVNGRYEVRRFLGEGGKKKVYLVHDRVLDRDVAFALIKTEGLDDVGRQRVVREARRWGAWARTRISSRYSTLARNKVRRTS